MHFPLLTSTSPQVNQRNLYYFTRHLLCNIVNKKDCWTISIVALDYRFEALLASRIPDSHLNVKSVIDFYNFRSELNTYLSYDVPTVTIYSFWKVSLVYRVSRELLPTADFPTMIILKVASSSFVALFFEFINWSKLPV